MHRWRLRNLLTSIDSAQRSPPGRRKPTNQASSRVLLAATVTGAAFAACAPIGRRTVLENRNLEHAAAKRFSNQYQSREDETPYDAIDFLSASEKKARGHLADGDAPGSTGLSPIAGYRPGEFQQPLDWNALRMPSALQVSWLGHACFLVQLGGVSILTDPVFTHLPFHWLFRQLERVSPPVVSARQMDFIDAVAISHNHHDHLDFGSLDDLPAARYFVPLRVGRYFGSRFRDVTEMDWYTTTHLGDVAITFLPAHHRSNRSLWDSNATLWGGWLFELEGKRVYFAGDTGYSRVFDDIHARTGEIDVCLLPVTAYRPYSYRWGHLTPEWAVEAAVALRCKTLIPWGYGTFTLGHEHVLEPLRRLDMARKCIAPTLSVRVLRMGETAAFD